MESCLLKNISHREYKAATELPQRICEVIAKLSRVEIKFNESTKPGEVLIKTLDRQGVSAKKYREHLKTAQTHKVIWVYHRPYSKIAVLIANDKYKNLSKLATPCFDCDSLKDKLKTLNFVVITIKNCESEDLKTILERIFSEVPEDSYCFIFYAGHGCEICNTKIILDVSCPPENITMDHCVTENYILQQVARCKPELCVLIMDMCRLHLDWTANPQLYNELLFTETHSLENINNLLISYATQASSKAYEQVQIECSNSISSSNTFEIKSEDWDKIVPGASQYVKALCGRFLDDLDVTSLLDKVHRDVENAMKKQKPTKIQCGVAKRSLHDPVKGDISQLLNKFRAISESYSEYCSLF